MNFLKLGASLYIPGTHKDLEAIIINKKYPNLKSVIIDTEDSVSEQDLKFAYKNIENLLSNISDSISTNTLTFIRVRNPNEFCKVLELKNIDKITGFVLPKFCVENMADYFKNIVPDKLYMPILEKNIFNLKELEKIKNFLLEYQEVIISLRIGATDILSDLAMRRNYNTPIYNIGVINQIISNIILIFKPHGFNITAPVWESINEDYNQSLKEEVKLDLLNGLFGKTIIHPKQIDLVQNEYKVNQADYNCALKILEQKSPAVFKLENRMNEIATHTNWARTIINQEKEYGLK